MQREAALSSHSASAGSVVRGRITESAATTAQGALTNFCQAVRTVNLEAPIAL